MGSFSLGTIWEETLAFLRQESGLLIPVALAIFAPAQILLSFAMAPASGAAGPPAASPQALLMLPALLLVIYGNLVLSVIALTPGVSVQEALAAAARRLPVTLLASVVLGGVFLVIVVVIGTIGLLLLGGGPSAASPAMSALVTIPSLFLMGRFLMLLPVLAVEKVGPIEAIRRGWALSRNNFLRFVGIVLLSMMLATLLAMIDKLVLGSLSGIVARVIGNAELPTLAHLIVGSAFGALLSAAVAVFIARTYRRVAA